MPNHGHLFGSAPPQCSPADLVGYFKGIRSRRLIQECPALRRQYGGKNAALGAAGYDAGTAGHVSADRIKRYIEACQQEWIPYLKLPPTCAIIEGMKLMAQVKLLPDTRQADALRRTMEQANAASQFVSDRAWETRTFRQYDLHHLCYQAIRTQFGLSAQVTVRVIGKVADAYKLDRQSKRTFRPAGGIAYDDRILSWRLDKSIVSIWTVEGRLHIPFTCGERQRALLQARQGETDLVTFRGLYLLSATCEVQEPEPIDVAGALGVDLGVTNIAVDSDGEVHSSSQVNNVRHRHRRLRAKLQRKGTKAARHRLRQLSGKEARFGQWVNHNISKRIVTKAKDTQRAVALENLEGIRQRVTVRKPQRATLHSWSFNQLRSFVAYKGIRAGVPVILVDPRNTSRTCPTCGCIDQRNRPSQSKFLCVSCGHAGLADRVAAINIGRRGEVSHPNVSTTPRVNPQGAFGSESRV